MCLGVPMKVQKVDKYQAVVLDEYQQSHIIDTTLVDELTCGDWVLVFRHEAREKLSEQYAQEIQETQNMLRAALMESADVSNYEPFVLPSQQNIV